MASFWKGLYDWKIRLSISVKYTHSLAQHHNLRCNKLEGEKMELTKCSPMPKEMAQVKSWAEEPKKGVAVGMGTGGAAYGS